MFNPRGWRQSLLCYCVCVFLVIAGVISCMTLSCGWGVSFTWAISPRPYKSFSAWYRPYDASLWCYDSCDILCAHVQNTDCCACAFFRSTNVETPGRSPLDERSLKAQDIIKMPFSPSKWKFAIPSSHFQLLDSLILRQFSSRKFVWQYCSLLWEQIKSVFHSCSRFLL